MGKNSLVMAGLLFLFSLNSIYAIDYYVDVNSIGGPCDDKNPGTIEKPWKTIARALRDQTPCPGPGDTIFLRDGVYNEEVTVMRGGTADKPLTIKAYPGEDPVIDAEGKRTNGIILPCGFWLNRSKGVMEADGTPTGRADHVVIDRLKVANATNGCGIGVMRRKGVVIKNTEVVNSGQGVYLDACTGCKVLKSNIHHCGWPVAFYAPSSDILIAGNQIHHSTVPMKSNGSDCINAGGYGESVIRSHSGSLASIEEAGPGLARVTVSDEKVLLNKKVDGTNRLRGTGDVAAGEVKLPNYLQLFYSVITSDSDDDEKDIVPGGPVQLRDGHKCFVLHNNPDWDNKPYSPDGRQGMFEIGQAKMEDLARARYFYIWRTADPALNRNRDIQILSNHVYEATRQGMRIFGTDNVLIQGNRIHDNGATGIQMENGCSNVWIEGNESYANCHLWGGETGIWLAMNTDAVVQNNILHENAVGMKVTACARVLVRRNVIYDNRAQYYVLAGINEILCGRSGSGGFVMNGLCVGCGDVKASVEESAFVHNTLYANGTIERRYNIGGLVYGLRGRPKIGQNLILNNIIRSETQNRILFIGKVLPLRMNGNLYYIPGRIADVIHQAADKKNDKTYSVVTKEGFEQYKKEMGLDAHSLFTDVAFLDVARKDFHLVKGSSAIDQGVPLARTAAEGKDEMLPVDNVWCFSAGFKNSKDETLIPGDEIMVGKTRVRVVGINRKENILTLDHKIKWKKDDPVNYVYMGSAPDVGAFEFGEKH